MRVRILAKILPLAIAAAAGLALLNSVGDAQADAEGGGAKPIRVLHLTGGCCHDYDQQKLILQAGLEERANVEFTVIHEGGKGSAHQYGLLKEKGWGDKFDVVLYNICFAKEADVDYIEGITKVHHDGLAAVALHCTYHSHHWNAETDAWEDFLGVSSRGHGPKAKIKVTNLEPEHPVMKGFPAEWTTPQGELYNVQETLTATPLAGGDNGKAKYDVIWFNEYGKGKVFGTTMGHHNETMSDPVYLDLVGRGLLWSVGHLGKDGKPAAGYGPVGVGCQ